MNKAMIEEQFGSKKKKKLHKHNFKKPYISNLKPGSLGNLSLWGKR